MTLIRENRNARSATSSETHPTRSSVRTKPSPFEQPPALAKVPPVLWHYHTFL